MPPMPAGQTGSPGDFRIVDLHFEHYASPHHLGARQTRPRLSWKFENAPDGFVQHGYTVEVYDQPASVPTKPISQSTIESQQSVLVPWPLSQPLTSRQRFFARVRAWGQESEVASWSNLASVEAGLLDREEWKAQRIAGPWAYADDIPQPEELFRKDFSLEQKQVERARLFITAQGVYEAEVNGQVVGDHFLAPGWTAYDKRLQYQTYDVTRHLFSNSYINTIAVRVAEGWFCGRISFDGGNRNIWGNRPALLAQLEVSYTDGTSELIVTDESWTASRGPTILAEIYNGEKYDARLEITGWSSPSKKGSFTTGEWQQVTVLDPLSNDIQLLPQESEPVRRVEVVPAVEKIVTPSGKYVLDFGQNLVGYTRIKNVKASKGHEITLLHAEVLEHGELGRRPLRAADNIDVYICKGCEMGESWEPRFTFHGFRYVQVDGWIDQENSRLIDSFEAVVCHTDMVRTGNFSCSNLLLNQLYKNTVWSMRGNFLSIPTDCPQRDERLGWTGDLAVFAPTATRLYNCTSMLKGWLEDLYAEQTKFGGVPPLVVPYTLEKHHIFGQVLPGAIWCDAAVLVPWALYQATGDEEILLTQFQSMIDWLSTIPKNEEGNTHLWKDSLPQLGDWLDPSAPPDRPAEAKTDAVLASNAFLIRSLEITAKAAQIIGRTDDAAKYNTWYRKARDEFASEYLSPNGRMMSDAQTSYALAIAFDLIPTEHQMKRASDRLAFIVRRHAFKIGTGFAGTPFICEALVQAGQPQIAYSMLLNKECPSWLYPVTKGATTIWERWDSMLQDNSINPGDMTSFNHYALGAVSNFLSERVAGLQCAAPGWQKIRICPLIGGDLTHATTSLETPYGKVTSSWKLDCEDGTELKLEVVIPPNASGEIVFPEGTEKEPVIISSGRHSLSVPFRPRNDWPILPISQW